MKILVSKKGTVDCYVDDYENGEGDFVNSWDFDVRGEYDSAEDLIKAIVKETYLFDFKVNEFVFEGGSITTSDLVDEENVQADKKDIELWKKGEKTLYSANMWLPLECVYDKHRMTDDEASHFGFY
jgi:hypothetical protein